MLNNTLSKLEAQRQRSDPFRVAQEVKGFYEKRDCSEMENKESWNPAEYATHVRSLSRSVKRRRTLQVMNNHHT